MLSSSSVSFGESFSKFLSEVFISVVGQLVISYYFCSMLCREDSGAATRSGEESEYSGKFIDGRGDFKVSGKLVGRVPVLSSDSL